MHRKYHPVKASIIQIYLQSNNISFKSDISEERYRYIATPSYMLVKENASKKSSLCVSSIVPRMAVYIERIWKTQAIAKIYAFVSSL